MPSYQLINTGAQLKASLAPHYRTPIYAIDCETDGLNPRSDQLQLIQIAIPAQPVFLIPLVNFRPQQLKPLQHLLQGDALKIFHAGKFDRNFLTQIGLEPKRPFFDTMLASQVLDAGLSLSHTLSALAKRYLGITLNKSLQTSDWSGKLLKSQLEYAATDASILLLLQPKLSQLLQNAQLTQTAQLEFDCLGAIGQMELNGMKLSTVKLENCRAENTAKIQDLRLALTELKPNTAQKSLFPQLQLNSINLDSPTQVLRGLQHAGLKIKSTSRKNLAPLANHPLVSALLAYRHANKLNSTYLEPLPTHVQPSTGRIHPQFFQCGTKSGRCSCRQPNLQNIPRGLIRSCFIAEPGNRLIKADYSQIELRILAYITGDRRMIKAYRQQEDLHQLTASLIFEIPLEQITREQRRLGKELNFGLIYGMGAARFLLECETKIEPGVITLKEAELFRRRFFETYPGIASWQKKLAAQTYSGAVREIRTLGGRRRQWETAPPLNELLNQPIQGSSADITKQAIKDWDESDRSPEALLVSQVHDEIVLECPTELAEIEARRLQSIMIAAAVPYLADFPVEVEVKIGESWTA